VVDLLGVPIEGAEVTARTSCSYGQKCPDLDPNKHGWCGPPSKTTYTDANGNYLFERVDGPDCFANCGWCFGAPWIIEAKKEGCDSQSKSVSLTNGDSKEVNFQLKCGIIFVDLKANPPKIKKGATSTLSWTSENADYCKWTLNLSGNANTSGSKVVSPEKTTTYEITCYNYQGDSASARATVEVIEEQAACNIGVYNWRGCVDKGFVCKGQCISLCWNWRFPSGGGRECTLNGIPLDQVGAVYDRDCECWVFKVCPPEDTTYTITCDGEVKCSNQVFVRPYPDIFSFNVFPNPVCFGKDVTWTWSSNADYCDFWNPMRQVISMGPGSGSYTEKTSFIGTWTYLLKCYNTFTQSPYTRCEKVATTSLTVCSYPTVQIWRSDYSNNPICRDISTTTIAWRSWPAQYCEWNDIGQVATSGQRTVGPLSQNTTFTLTCHNSCGEDDCTSSQSITIPVTDCKYYCVPWYGYKCTPSASPISGLYGYSSLGECQENCTTSVTTYSCDINNHICYLDKNGIYSSSWACQNDCQPYSCDLPNQKCSPRTNGEYPTRSACEKECVAHYHCNTSAEPWKCEAKKDGEYSSQAACEADCQPKLCEWNECKDEDCTTTTSTVRQSEECPKSKCQNDDDCKGGGPGIPNWEWKEIPPFIISGVKRIGKFFHILYADLSRSAPIF
jgi:hypothetical protein